MTLVAVLVPTTGRAKQARERLTALVDQPLPAGVDLLVVAAIPVHDDATLAALVDINGLYLVSRPSRSSAVEGWSIASLAARRLSPPPDWYVLGADDIVWVEGWLAEALRVATLTGAHVIGFSDGGHTDLTQYAPHYMVSRQWLDEQMNGCIAPLAYQSWWFDREVCERAQSLGVYAPAPDAVLDHHHPDWGKAELDDTYRDALRLHDADRTVYLARQKEWALKGIGLHA